MRQSQNCQAIATVADSPSSQYGLPDCLTVTGNYVRFVPQGYVSLQEATTLVSCAIAFCCDEGRSRLLVNGIGLVGFDPPTLGERYAIVKEWARVGAGRVVIAVVTRPEYIHPEKFGIFAAYRLGLKGDVFEAEEDALNWLLQQHPLPLIRCGRADTDNRQMP